MKKVVRTVWIGLLSGLAFLVACTSTKGLSRAQKKELQAERAELMVQIEQKQEEALQYNDLKFAKNRLAVKEEELNLRQRVDEINQTLRDEEAIVDNQSWMNGIFEEMESLRAAIKKAEDAARIIPCVYGPPR